MKEEEESHIGSIAKLIRNALLDWRGYEGPRIRP